MMGSATVIAITLILLLGIIANFDTTRGVQGKCSKPHKTIKCSRRKPDACPMSYICSRKDNFKCCKQNPPITCTDDKGNIRKENDEWKHSDQCNTCTCGKQGKIECTNKKGCSDCLNPHPSVKCSRRSDACPNSYKCSKVKNDDRCCQYSRPETCKTIYADPPKNLIPKSCTVRGNRPCPGGYKCQSFGGNKFTMCCLEKVTTCKDNKGNIRKENEKWKDQCNTCSCKKQGKIECTKKTCTTTPSPQHGKCHPSIKCSRRSPDACPKTYQCSRSNNFRCCKEDIMKPTTCTDDKGNIREENEKWRHSDQCNTCTCEKQGKIECTKISCRKLPDQPQDKCHPSIKCSRSNPDGCPNSYKCSKKEYKCCQHNIPETCRTIYKDSPANLIPRSCRGGGSKPCPGGYTCKSFEGNLFTMCCSDDIATCKDDEGNIHKESEEWLHPDKCNKCTCGADGKMECTNEKKCPSYCTKNGQIEWIKDTCQKCYCDKNQLKNCESQCDGAQNKAQPVTSKCENSCSKTAKLEMCQGKKGKKETCTETKVEISTCPAMNSNKCEPGIRLTESTAIITGGDEVTPKYNYRWMVHYEINWGCRCGGTIISSRHILTAAHCMDSLSRSQSITIKTGKHNLKDKEPYEQSRIVQVSSIKIHKSYKNFDNDIAIIEVKPPLRLDKYTQPIALPKIQELNINQIDKKLCKVIGWGDTTGIRTIGCKNMKLSDVLMETEIKPQKDCSLDRNDKERVTDNMFCAGSKKGKDSCFGDSGGPLICRDSKRNNIWELYGIVSWGPANSCGKMSGVYTKVTNYIDWIMENTGGWGDFSAFTSCTVTCGGGKKSRMKLCQRPPSLPHGKCPDIPKKKNNYLKEVDGEQVWIEEQECNQNRCK